MGMDEQRTYPDEQAYEQAANDYLFVKQRVQAHLTPDGDPVLQAALQALQAANDDLHWDLRTSWMDLHNMNDDPVYRAELFGRCHVVFLGLRTLATKARRLPKAQKR